MKTWENPMKSEGKEETVMPNCKNKLYGFAVLRKQNKDLCN
jgi:hypothetical protein